MLPSRPPGSYQGLSVRLVCLLVCLVLVLLLLLSPAWLFSFRTFPVSHVPACDRSLSLALSPTTPTQSNPVPSNPIRLIRSILSRPGPVHPTQPRSGLSSDDPHPALDRTLIQPTHATITLPTLLPRKLRATKTATTLGRSPSPPPHRQIRSTTRQHVRAMDPKR
jgi:hypothetical protein